MTQVWVSVHFNIRVCQTDKFQKLEQLIIEFRLPVEVEKRSWLAHDVKQCYLRGCLGNRIFTSNQLSPWATKRCTDGWIVWVQAFLKVHDQHKTWPLPCTSKQSHFTFLYLHGCWPFIYSDCFLCIDNQRQSGFDLLTPTGHQRPGQGFVVAKCQKGTFLRNWKVLRSLTKP